MLTPVGSPKKRGKPLGLSAVLGAGAALGKAREMVVQWLRGRGGGENMKGKRGGAEPRKRGGFQTMFQG